MRCKLRWGVTIAVLAAVATLTGGSGAVVRADPADAGLTVNGGGWLLSVLGGAKVTLTLQGTYTPDEATGILGVSTGSGELHDHSKNGNVDAHLDAGPNTFTLC